MLLSVVFINDEWTQPSHGGDGEDGSRKLQSFKLDRHPFWFSVLPLCLIPNAQIPILMYYTVIFREKWLINPTKIQFSGVVSKKPNEKLTQKMELNLDSHHVCVHYNAMLWS